MGAREKFVIKQDPRWPDAHIRLQALFGDEARRPPWMTQEKFGAEYGIGSQGMVWQYLNGYTPLNIEAAAKFAQGLRCTIRDISPEMDAVMRGQILPAMGLSAWGKVATILLLITSLHFTPQPADAAILHNINMQHYVANNLNYLYIIRSIGRRIRLFLRRWLGLEFALPSP